MHEVYLSRIGGFCSRGLEVYTRDGGQLLYTEDKKLRIVDYRGYHRHIEGLVRGNLLKPLSFKEVI